jgi:hypothetical protein
MHSNDLSKTSISTDGLEETMRIVPGFIIRQIAGETVAIPSGASAQLLSGLVALNGSALLLFQLLQTEQTTDTLVHAITDSYEIDLATARTDVEEFLDLLRENQLLIEE